MKNTMYDTELIMTKDALLATKCSCKCGREHDEAISCVHVLPLIFWFFLLMMDGLSENTLLALVPRLSEASNYTFEQDEETRLRKSIHTLMISEGIAASFCSE